MTKHCSFCGAKLYETNHGRWYCPNCGIVDEGNRDDHESSGDVSYIG
jgi:uncharacterized Zn finger protein (UPF0148 family)